MAILQVKLGQPVAPLILKLCSSLFQASLWDNLKLFISFFEVGR